MELGTYNKRGVTQGDVKLANDVVCEDGVFTLSDIVLKVQVYDEDEMADVSYFKPHY